MRTLLILDGTNLTREALTDAKALCDPGDRLTVLAVAEKPSPAMTGWAPAMADPYTGGKAGELAGGGPDVPVLETDDDTERRIAGELRDRVDEQAAAFDRGDVELWTQAIVRDEPGGALAAYVRSSDVARIAFPRSSLQRLREVLCDSEGRDTLNGKLAPIIVLPD